MIQFYWAWFFLANEVCLASSIFRRNISEQYFLTSFHWLLNSRENFQDIFPYELQYLFIYMGNEEREDIAYPAAFITTIIATEMICIARLLSWEKSVRNMSLNTKTERAALPWQQIGLHRGCSNILAICIDKWWWSLTMQGFYYPNQLGYRRARAQISASLLLQSNSSNNK